MDVITADDLQLRLAALTDSLAGRDAGGGRRWILLDKYNKKVTKHHPHAIQLIDLLSLSDDSMKASFGTQWRGAFRQKQKGLGVGFTYRG